MGKSPDAFRTISEVADWLGIQAHVLRFWESKFTQVKPIKRAGGRRYYRPADMLLLGGIQKLLHEDGLTIKGVQKILREEGMSHVAAMSPALDELTLSQIDEDALDIAQAPEPLPEVAEEKGVILSFDPPADKVKKDPEPVEVEEEQRASLTPELDEATPVEEPVAQADAPRAEDQTSTPDIESPAVDEQAVARTVAPEQAPEPLVEGPTPEVPEQEPIEAQNDEPPEEPPAALPAFLRRPLVAPEDKVEEPAESNEQTAPAPEEAPEAPATEPEPAPEPPAPKPRVLDLPPFTSEQDIAARPALLTAVYKTPKINAAAAKDIAPLLDKLSRLRDSMSAQRRGGNG